MEKCNYFSNLLEKAKTALDKTVTSSDTELHQLIWDIYAGLCAYQKMYVEYFTRTQELNKEIETLKEKLDFYRKQEIFDSQKYTEAYNKGVEDWKTYCIEAISDYIRSYRPIKSGTAVIITNEPSYSGCYGTIVSYNDSDGCALIELKNTGMQLCLRKDQYSIITKN